MKKAAAAIVAALFMLLNIDAAAVIQYPPKDTDITVNVPVYDIPPVIDGEIGEDEYCSLQIDRTSLSFVVGSESDWSRVRDTVFTAYACVCSDCFYFALKTQLPAQYYKTDCEPRLMWAQTALLISLAPAGSSGRTALEFGIRPNGQSYVFNKYAGKQLDLTGSFSATYSDGIAVYEVKVPLSAFGAEGKDRFSFCFSISEGNFYDNERIAYVQFGQGISGFSTAEDANAGKDAALFPTVILTDQSGVTVTEPPDTEPSEPPDTGSDLLVWAAVIVATALVVAALIANAKRKRA
ncbi:MAG: hypothetical protein J5585_01535 [Clostridia bacterium]|nr:hypothetical protein [Clostridia bacterium]